jgi:hypothetical protein
MLQRDWSLRSCAWLCFLVSAAPCVASDGVIEINQECATLAGCLPGDAARFPVTITAPGSYRLTSNLGVPDENTSAIRVEASGVSIDLNGFEISGVTACPGLPPVCSPTGLAHGVEVDDDGLRVGVAVRGGTIRGMGRGGVFLGPQSAVERLRVRENGVVGIEVGAYSSVRECEVLSNGLRGIAASDCVVRGNTVANHATAGIQVTECVVSQNVATLNGGVGISVGGSSSVVENEASGNRGHGIIASGDSSLFDNTVINNAAFLGPAFDGITCFGDCNVRGNTANMNSGRGLVLGTQSVYRENLLVGNAVGGVSGGVNTGDNHCAGAGVVAASCP